MVYLLMWNHLVSALQQGDIRLLSRTISLVENRYDGYFTMLQNLEVKRTPVTGITGPPGAGKSTLVDALIGAMVAEGLRVGVLCIDPSSPFNLGALLGDRIRMSAWYNNPNVYIRSLATRGSLGGLNPQIIEITDVLKAAPFDHIIIETVGVGQSEVEIAGLADTSVVVLVPEAGDDIQTMKAGLMEIADIFVVNKSDREGADRFVKNLRHMLSPEYHAVPKKIPVVKTIADKGEGITELVAAIKFQAKSVRSSDKRYQLLAQKALLLIQDHRMKNVDRTLIINRIREDADKERFNLYTLVKTFL